MADQKTHLRHLGINTRTSHRSQSGHYLASPSTPQHPKVQSRLRVYISCGNISSAQRSVKTLKMLQLQIVLEAEPKLLLVLLEYWYRTQTSIRPPGSHHGKQLSPAETKNTDVGAFRLETHTQTETPAMQAQKAPHKVLCHCTQPQHIYCARNIRARVQKQAISHVPCLVHKK